MESDERNRMIPGDRIMNDPIFPLLVDYIDGTLSDDRSTAVRLHLTECDLCRNTVESMLHSRLLTDEVRDRKKAWIDSISVEHREKQIASIKQKIHPAGNKVRILSRNRAMVSTAAGFVILLLVAFLFLKGTDIFTNPSRNSSKTILSPTTDKGYDFAASTGMQEMESASQPSAKSMSPDKDGRTNTQDTAVVLNNGVPLFNQDDITAAAAKILIAPDYSRDMTKFLQGALSCLVISDNKTSCQIITAFPSSMTQAKIEELKVLQGNWFSLSLTTKIEIISRGNAQKLVEYTSKENATLLQTNAENHSAEFMVISVYRG